MIEFEPEDPAVPDEPYDAFVWSIVRTGDLRLIDDALRAGAPRQEEDVDDRG